MEHRTTAARVPLQRETPDSDHVAEGLVAEPMSGLRRRGYLVFEFIDDILHLGVASVLVVIAAAVFLHMVVFQFTDPKLFHPTLKDFFDVVLNVINTVLFVVIVLEILATVVHHLRERTFAVRPLLIIGVISSVRHILIVTAHMSTESGVTPADLFTQQITELLVNTIVTLLLVLCYLYVTRADLLGSRRSLGSEE